MHWCQDETYAVMSGVPVVGYFFKRIHKWYHNKTHHKCHHQGCESDHAEHVTPGGETLLPNPPGRYVIQPETVDVLFGDLATILLMFDRRLLKTINFPEPNEFVWFAQDNQLSARWKNKFFQWDGTEWSLEPSKVPPTREEQFDVAASIIRKLIGEEITSENVAEAQAFLESL